MGDFKTQQIEEMVAALLNPINEEPQCYDYWRKKLLQNGGSFSQRLFQDVLTKSTAIYEASALPLMEEALQEIRSITGSGIFNNGTAEQLGGQFRIILHDIADEALKDRGE